MYWTGAGEALTAAQRRRAHHRLGHHRARALRAASARRALAGGHVMGGSGVLDDRIPSLCDEIGQNSQNSQNSQNHRVAQKSLMTQNPGGLTYRATSAILEV